MGNGPLAFRMQALGTYAPTLNANLHDRDLLFMITVMQRVLEWDLSYVIISRCATNSQNDASKHRSVRDDRFTISNNE